MRLTTELLEKIKAWKEAGDRDVDIKLGRREIEKGWTVWLYDYSIMAGIHLSNENLEKDWDRLILSKKRNDLAEELAKLDEKIGGAA